MIRAPLSTTSVLDEGADAVRLAAFPWVAVLLAASLPYRFMQAVFVDQLLDLGSDAGRYGNLLASLATATMIAFVVSRWGRLVFARAVRLADAGGSSPGVEALRVPPAALLDYLTLATLAETLSAITAITFFGPILCTMLSGLAIGTAELNATPSLIAPCRNIARYARETKIVAALLLVFACAFVIACINVAGAFGLGLWLWSATGWGDVPRWSALFSFHNRRFLLAVIAGGLLAIEPFWVAAHVMLVRKGGAEESGDDLRVWFEELRRA